MYNYFCNWCGHHFTSSTPERDATGILNDIPCPECGSLCVYPDTDDAYLEARKAQNEYEAKQTKWEEE